MLAAICHASILMPTTGIAIPILVWATQKEKSPFLRFQALQAAAYHLVWTLLNMVGGILYVLSFVGMFVPVLFTPFVTEDVLAMMMLAGMSLPVFAIGVLLLFSLGGIGYGLVAALLTGLGRPFRYPLLGHWLEASLAADPAPSAP